jgi:thioesterase domain-containing protein
MQINDKKHRHHFVYVCAREGDDNYVANAVKEIETWKKANPDGALTIMGYSYGGVVALKLARELDKKDIRVNLLVTLDAANGTGSDKVDRTVTDNVDWNVNYYQTNETVSCGEEGIVSEISEFAKNQMKSKGGENKLSEGNYNTRITNINETDATYEGTDDNCNGSVNHYNIDDKNKDNIVNEVKKVSP